MDRDRLDPVEIRILGCLVEKEMTTPEYYPLTRNALVNACGQKSNRNPVMEIDEETVSTTLEHLREKHLVLLVDGAGMRVPRFEHNLRETWELDDPEIAILAELMLRGPQTTGQLRGHASRMCPFDSLQEVSGVMDRLQRAEPPFTAILPLRPGSREARFCHLLGDPPDEQIERDEPVVAKVVTGTERIEALESQVAVLTEKIEALEEALESFRKQFE